MAESKLLFNANDGFTGRDGGPYLDLEQAREAEKQRALVEGREPDYENPPANAGILLQTGDKQAATIGVNNLPSQEGRGVVNNGLLFKDAVDNDDSLLQSWGEIPPEAWEDKTNPDSPEGTFDVATQTVINEDTVDSDGNVKKPVAGGGTENVGSPNATDDSADFDFDK